MKSKKSIGYIIVALLAVTLVGFGIHSFTANSASKDSDIVVGSQGSDYDIWQHIAKSPQAKKLGLHISVKQINDGVQLNKATTDGTVDVNAFQSWSYLQAYNKENKAGQLKALGTTYLEPLGIYSNKYKNVKDIPNGTTVAIVNNPANTSRDLLLLQSAGLLKLKPGFNALGDTRDIASNPRHLKFDEIDDTTGPRVLKSVPVVLISNKVALEGNLNVLKDSIFHEQVNDSTKDNINVLATAKKNANNDKYKKLINLYHEPAIQKYIKAKYDGTKVEVKKPLSYLNK
ncbi:MetQ/NlpA family ABC transporter substrate-binding protein [Lentilactobacillus sp. SPB1-3]|uniref:MetQ/NlpA family ABC transporter substrate-binding protein n=1 Tax=Lentilactobacillus terminaliae TaxID=3003483 RepID=A0ACD5DDR2_9LACO|nr:MetQ/NlpA family ABC transporter substrate-binding protein [Lentilactobacillus sp. SPB1-3]MCZ0977782.1 MetQ/NlpA family ABC transporter substrate-binding protein [Lentilactobacillus sp. SPB1-3]